MKISNFYRENWRAMGDWSLTTLDNIIASIQGSWHKEHLSDDTHGHVHAESLQTGRISFNNVLTTTFFEGSTVNNFNDALLKDAGIWRISISGTTSDVTITGIQIPLDEKSAAIDGRLLIIENIDDTQDIVLTHLGSTSNATAQFRFPNAQNVMIAPHSFIILVYNLTLSKWVTQTSGSSWISIPYSAGNFTAAGGGTWTVDSGDITTLAYSVDGKLCHVMFEIANTDVGGAPGYLSIALPITVAKQTRNLILVKDAGAANAVGQVIVIAATAALFLYVDLTGGANWTNTAADNTNVSGQITFEIQ